MTIAIERYPKYSAGSDEVVSRQLRNVRTLYLLAKCEDGAGWLSKTRNRPHRVFMEKCDGGGAVTVTLVIKEPGDPDARGATQKPENCFSQMKLNSGG
jgi:hypothetical protein